LLTFFQIQAPPLITAILGAFTLFLCLFWLVRRQERVFAWLAAIGFFWGLHILQLASGDGGFAWTSMYVLPVAMTGFAASYLHLDDQGKYLKAAALVTLLAIVMKAGSLSFGLSPWLAHGWFLISSVALMVLLSRASHHTPEHQDIALLIVGIVALLVALHDTGRQTQTWAGTGFALMPYAGLLVFMVFGFVLGLRILDALSVEENLNIILENRARAANASLAASEAARRALEVSGAITHERDRLMREIHDGIGSSLVTALAASERQGRAVDGPAMLKRALTDLRIAVDSLEPVQGDIATLMASLRYRVEPDIKKAGIEFDWQVEEVPEFDWLDAVNALHVLRIFQEAFSNIVGHAEATRITVRCHTEMHRERAGVLIEVADNGVGFVDDGGPRGHGLKNMASRAEALDGELVHVSKPGQGTSVSLWLPISRGDE
jgi:signal transduction histidine kinase